MPSKKLFSEFDSVSAKAWKQKIQFDLKGADYNESLVCESLEGIKVKPFYHADDEVHESKALHASKAFSIGQSIFVANAEGANEKAKQFLAKGAESLYFILPSDVIELTPLFEGIDISKTVVYIELQFLSANYVRQIHAIIGDAHKNLYLNIDLIGNLARTGNWFFNLEKDHKELDAILGFEMQNSLSVDVALYQNAGANRIQQLAYALAHANEYLNHINTNGCSSTLTFKVAVDTHYFFEIAKLRALRLLYANLAKVYGVAEVCHIIAIPTQRNKTVYNFNSNMMRTTTESMAAVSGGADVVINAPYDAIFHKNNEFGDRIALNQLLLLKNESYFDKVQNPADGSYYIESLTHDLAEKALQLFKDIEKSGGFMKQMKAHNIQRKIEESAQKEQALFDTGKAVLVGTTIFQNEKDKMKDMLELYPFLKTNTRKTLIQPILEKRLAEKTEQKRLADE